MSWLKDILDRVLGRKPRDYPTPTKGWKPPLEYEQAMRPIPRQRPPAAPAKIIRPGTSTGSRSNDPDLTTPIIIGAAFGAGHSHSGQCGSGGGYAGGSGGDGGGSGGGGDGGAS